MNMEGMEREKGAIVRLWRWESSTSASPRFVLVLVCLFNEVKSHQFGISEATLKYESVSEVA